MKTSDKSRMLWIDGLKGLSCLGIFMHHFMYAFYPASIISTAAIPHFKYETKLSQSALSVFFNGNFLVFVFCILSGYLISASTLKSKKINVTNSITKRYLKLTIPVIIIGIVVWLLSSFNLFFNQEVSMITSSDWLRMFYAEKVSLFNVLKSSIFIAPFFGDTYISNAFWMYGYILSGSSLIYLFGPLLKKEKINILFVIIPLIGFIFTANFLACFVIGYLLCLLFNSDFVKNMKYKNIIGFVLILIGLYFGGYPSCIVPTNYYAITTFSNCFYPHLIGACCLIIGINFTNIFKRILSNRLFVNLGKISFSIFLIHIPLIFSYSTFLFKKLIPNHRYNYDCLIVFISTLIILIILSYLFNLLEKRISKYVNSKIEGKTSLTVNI